MSDIKRLLSAAYMRGYIDARNDKAIDPIGAIEQLTMNLNKSDLISRQDALNCINKLYAGHTACNMFEALDTVAEYIEELPSAESEAYNRGWEEGREALRKEIWEDGRDRLD